MENDKIEQIKQTIIAYLDDNKAIDTVSIPVSDMTSVTDYMIITTGRSTRHVQAMADNLVVAMKEVDIPPNHVEGKTNGQWVLIDFGVAIVHIMVENMREYYDLESIWSIDAT